MNNKENGNVLVIWIKKYWFIIFVIVLCTIKQLMVTNLPVFARDAGGPDQYKLLIDAEMLFDELTLGSGTNVVHLAST